MLIVQNYSTAVIFCFITMVCWGSWANTQKLTASTWRFELFYWDYVIGIVLFASILGITLGSWGSEGRSFIVDLKQADSSSLGNALLGGIIFNAANILLGAAIAIAGMSVAFPVGIGLALVIGVIVNYIDSPIGDPLWLFVGVAFIALAILLNAWAYKSITQKTSGTSTKGLLLSIVSGCMMGLFYKYVAASMFPDFESPVAGMLSPYSAIFMFSLGILASNVIFNTLFMLKPFTGTPVTYVDYFRGTTRNHLVGMLGGIIWCMGMSFSIIASGKAGPAISYGLGQGATIVAALWGIYIWKEFKGASSSTNRVLSIMLLSYCVGLALIIIAR